MRKKILIVVDMQNDFITGSLANEEAVAIIPNVVDKVKEYTYNGDMIFFTMDTHHDTYLQTEEGKNLPIEHCIDGTWGQEIIDDLQPYLDNNNVTIFEKETFGSREMASCISNTIWNKWNETRKIVDDDIEFEIELIGVCTDICVVSNALLIKAFLPYTHISVDASCCAGTTPENHQKALDIMRSCQVTVYKERIPSLEDIILLYPTIKEAEYGFKEFMAKNYEILKAIKNRDITICDGRHIMFMIESEAEKESAGRGNIRIVSEGETFCL